MSGEGPTYLRFTPVQRLQHLVLIVSFTVLALTGLPQKYASAAVGAPAPGAAGRTRRPH